MRKPTRQSLVMFAGAALVAAVRARGPGPARAALATRAHLSAFPRSRAWHETRYIFGSCTQSQLSQDERKDLT